MPKASNLISILLEVINGNSALSHLCVENTAAVGITPSLRGSGLSLSQLLSRNLETTSCDETELWRIVEGWRCASCTKIHCALRGLPQTLVRVVSATRSERQRKCMWSRCSFAKNSGIQVFLIVALAPLLSSTTTLSVYWFDEAHDTTAAGSPRKRSSCVSHLLLTCCVVCEWS